MTRPSTAGDACFFRQSGPHSLAEIAQVAGAVVDPAWEGRMLEGVAPLQSAGANQVSFLDNRKYITALAETRAAAVMVHPDMLRHVPIGCVPLATSEPYLGWARVVALFHPLPDLVASRHPSALVDPTADVHPSAEIAANVVIGRRASIGADTEIGVGTVIGDGVAIGRFCRIGAHCSISHAIIGDRVMTAPGVRIGQEGFGFATTMEATGPRYLTVPQVGRVLIEDDVEIGANTTIDRGSAQDTVVGAGSRIDNLVQIAHNVRLGRGCVIVAQVGISGSTVLEDFVVVAGQVGFAGHVHVGRGARIGGKAGVMGDVPAGADYVGSPAQPAKQFFREHAILRKIAGERLASRAEAAMASAPGDPAAGPAKEMGSD